MRRDVVYFVAVIWLAQALGFYLSSVLHELGHGLVAIFLGGEFNGFAVTLDGGGWALASGAYLVPIYASGVIVSLSCAAAAIGAALRSPSRRALIVLVAMASAAGVKEPTYVIQSLLHPSGLTDFGFIMEFTGYESVKEVMTMSCLSLVLFSLVFQQVVIAALTVMVHSTPPLFLRMLAAGVPPSIILMIPGYLPQTRHFVVYSVVPLLLIISLIPPLPFMTSTIARRRNLPGYRSTLAALGCTLAVIVGVIAALDDREITWS